MAKVQVLSDQVANQIAAGEVIERPASVVKELVENSIDSGATSVEVEFKSGGKSYIRIEDNGCGMCREDALLSLKRHATSKIRKADDLENIMTMGFRGEALPSIASVSKFLLQTREKGTDSGAEILIDGGKTVHEKDCGMPGGTRMTISNLFNTVPARRKFLKSVATESAHIVHHTRLYALAHPEVAFTLIDDGRVLFRTPACKRLSDRVGEIFGKAIVSKLMPIDATEGEMRLSGLIGKPGQSKTSRHEMLVFVNGRPVENRTLGYALIESYHGHIPKGRYPVAFLFMEIPPRLLDVNVHPAKREIRFRNETQVRGFAVRTILEALNQTAKSSSPTYESVRLPKEDKSIELSLLNDSDEDVSSGKEKVSPPSGKAVLKQSRRLVKRIESVETKGFESEKKSRHKVARVDAQSSAVDRSGADVKVSSGSGVPVDWVFVGWSGRGFALFDSNSGIVLLDAKSAQRRVLYERLRRQFSESKTESQKLLLAVPVEFDPVSAALLEDQTELMTSYGFEIEPFGRNFFRIEAVPTWLDESESENFLREVVEMLRLDKISKENTELAEDRLARFAALKSSRAENELGKSQLDALLDELFSCTNPLADPDGKPTFVELNQAELNRRFQRKPKDEAMDLY